MRVAQMGGSEEETLSNFALYIIGYVVVIAGLAWGGYTLGAPPLWIGIGAVVLIGIGIVTGVSKTRYREPSPDDRGTRRVVVDE
jgi:hypothetical protein